MGVIAKSAPAVGGPVEQAPTRMVQLVSPGSRPTIHRRVSPKVRSMKWSAAPGSSARGGSAGSALLAVGEQAANRGRVRVAPAESELVNLGLDTRPPNHLAHRASWNRTPPA
jgi:hypothetical protein